VRDDAYVMQVGRSWLSQPWGKERFTNLRHPCCDNIAFTSNYSLPHLHTLAALEGVPFHFLRGAGPDAGPMRALALTLSPHPSPHNPHITLTLTLSP